MRTQKTILASAFAVAAVSFISFSYYFPGTPTKPIDPTTFNKTIKPGDDFYEYINSTWIKNNPIPSSRAKWGSFYILDDSSQAVVHRIVMKAASNTKAVKGSSTQKTGDFFYSGMDSVKIEKDGLKPVQSYFDEINAIKNTDDLTIAVAHQHMMFNGVMFTGYVAADLMDSKMNILQFGQGGLGLPDRDFYFNAQTEQIRTAYKTYMTNLFKLLGYDAAKAANAVTATWNIEVALANFSKDNVSLRDPYSNYTKQTYTGLKSSMPYFNWDLYFKAMNVTGVNEVINGQPVFMDELNKMMKSTSIEDWKAYMIFHMIDFASAYANKALEEENFNFHSKTLNGVKQMKPRWRRVLEAENFCLGELLGQEYVKVKFTADAKTKAQNLIKNLMASLNTRINNLLWMSAETKKKALEKLSAITVKVGYPDKWRDYTLLDINRDSYLSNIVNSLKFAFNRNMGKINKPVDKSEWQMTPQTVNAYYEPTNNEIVFPAAILQPPFFDATADNAVNYGGIGVVIGHELTHGFDDQGRLFDAIGNLKNWWTPEDSAQYAKRTDMIVKSYSAFCPQDSLCINGNLTLGENIADIGGLTIAYYAFQMEQKLHPQAALIDGLTPEQRYFINFAIIWRGAYTDQSMRQQLMTNPHSPGKWRVLGTLCNMQEFYTAFNVKEGDKMWKPANERAQIW